jgi:hypothetical protein
MARPTRLVIASGIAAWDADTDENFDIIAGAPFPMVQEANTTDLATNFPADEYDDCFALVDDVIYISNGTSWEVYRQSANVADSTATTVSEMATDFNELLAALQSANIMATS